MSRTQRTRTERDVANERERSARQILQLAEDNNRRLEQQMMANRVDTINWLNNVQNAETVRLEKAYEHNQNILGKNLDVLLRASKMICESNNEVVRIRDTQASIGASTSQPLQAISPPPTYYHSPQRYQNRNQQNDTLIGFIILGCVVVLFLILLFK